MSEPFIAEIRIFAGNYAPRDWAFCNGQLVPVSQNTALFSLVGTTYGGDGRTTFGLPDLQNRLPMHPGRGPGLTDRRLGQRGGVDTVTLTNINQMGSHSHAVLATADAPDTNSPAGALPASGPVYEEGGNLVAMSTNAVGSSGGGQAHTNLQPYLALNFIIALQGLYPSRP